MAEIETVTDRTEVSTTELARVLGITARRVQQMAQDGTLNLVRRGRFNLCESIQQYIKFLASEKESGSQDKERQIAETSFKKARAIVAMLEAQELQGKMHRSDDVAEFWDDMGYAIRSVLLALPGRVAVDMAEATGADPAVCADLIRKECVKGMEELRQHRYDPKKYEEKVRGRMSWDNFAAGPEDDT